MINKLLLLATILFFTLNVSFAQDKALHKDAKAYCDAIFNQDDEHIVDLTFENVLELGGGPFYLKEELANDRKIAAEQNIKVLGVEAIVDQKKVLEDDEIQTIITQEILIDFNGKKFKTFNNLFAISIDRGASWKFVDLQKHDAESIKAFIPNFSKDLQFPELREAEALEE